MTGDKQSPARTGAILMLFSACLMLAGGSYLFFVAGETTGIVFMGASVTFAAVAAAVGIQAKKKGDK